MSAFTKRLSDTFFKIIKVYRVIAYEWMCSFEFNIFVERSRINWTEPAFVNYTMWRFSTRFGLFKMLFFKNWFKKAHIIHVSVIPAI